MENSQLEIHERKAGQSNTIHQLTDKLCLQTGQRVRSQKDGVQDQGHVSTAAWAACHPGVFGKNNSWNLTSYKNYAFNTGGFEHCELGQPKLGGLRFVAEYWPNAHCRSFWQLCLRHAWNLVKFFRDALPKIEIHWIEIRLLSEGLEENIGSDHVVGSC